MTLEVRVAPEAEAELMAAARWYETRCAGLGADLVAAVDEAMEAISDRPLAHPIWRADLPFRRHTMRRFPDLVFFTDGVEAVQVVAIAHAKRRPGYWRDRR